MKRIISITLLLAMAFSMVASAASVKGFSDVPKTEWSYNYIMLCAQNGAVNGTTNPDENGIATFAPKMEVSLGQFLAAMTKLLCPSLVKPLEEGQQWTLPYYNAAVEAKLISKSEFDYSNINEKLSREDMAYILVSAAKYNGEVLSAKDGIENAIADYDKVSANRKDAVEKAYSNGLITGTDANGTFAPKNSMTREQMATVICRLMKWTERAEVVITQKTPEGYVNDGGKADTELAVIGFVAGKFADTKTARENRPAPNPGASKRTAMSDLTSLMHEYCMLRFFDHGIGQNIEDDGRIAKFVTRNDGKTGINVFGWRKSYNSDVTTNAGLNLVLEAFYYLSGDRYVAKALWDWIDADNINRGANSDSFGFSDVRGTANGGVIEMNGVQIEVDFSGAGTTFYFN